ncbi:MAG TPA: peptide chain release factor-like protein [Miltoncostaeaceae bacterium]|nr:peptide chain release factor-like protein [Miltoncostaeaceae bacterium]
MSPDEVAALLAGRGAWTYSRASGPGGQRRDHAETRAELTIRREDLEGIPEPVAERLAARLRLDARPLRLSSQTDRSRERNREIVLARLERRVADAMAPPAPPRRPTRPSRGATERRLAEKARRSQRKAQRRPPPGDD